MEKISLKDVTQYVEEHIGTFHEKRLSSLKKLKLKDVLERKNPYLFKAKYVLTASEIIKSLADASISSGEETIFGNWLEGLAIYINEKVYLGWKSGIDGIDLEFDKDNTRYLVSIKSGPNWANSQALPKMRASFIKAKQTLRTSNSKINVVAVNGCCYGKERKFDRGDYYKYCGQKFWEFISGDPDFYVKIIEPLGHQAKERNEDFMQSYSQMLNKFTREFTETFCKKNGEIDWDKLVRFNSGQAELKD